MPPRFEGNLAGYLAAVLEAHPALDTGQDLFRTDQPGDEGRWISADLLRAATRWARQQRSISWEFATTIETFCRQMEHYTASTDAASGEYRSVRAAAKAAGFVRDPAPLDYLHRYWRKVSPEDRLRFLIEMLTPNERRALMEGFEEEDT